MRRLSLIALSIAAGCGSAATASPSNVVMASGSAAADEGYPIVLSRPARVGESHREHTVQTESETRVVTRGGAVVEQSAHERTIELTARVLVRQVNHRGKPTLLEYDVERCVVREAGAEREIVPAGAVLRVTRTPRGQGEGSIELAGGSLSEADIELLDAVISTSFGPTGDDDIFGSDEPRRVGESWPIDRALAARDLNKLPHIAIAEDQVSGRMTLEALEEVNGVPSLRMRGELRADFSMSGVPGGTIEIGELNARMSGSFPVDTSLGRLRETEELEMHIRVRAPTPDGQEVVVDMRSTEREVSEYTRTLRP